MVVCAIEHADGSAAFTSRLNGTIEIPHQHPHIDNLDEGETVDEGLLKFRTRQVNQRRDEIIEGIQILKEMKDPTACPLKRKLFLKLFLKYFIKNNNFNSIIPKFIHC